MIGKVETKMAPVGIFGVQSVPFLVTGDLPNIPIIGSSIAASVGYTYGVDKIAFGAQDGQRVGSRINPKN